MKQNYKLGTAHIILFVITGVIIAWSGIAAINSGATSLGLSIFIIASIVAIFYLFMVPTTISSNDDEICINFPITLK